MRLPPTSTSTRMVFAPASMAFSSSSFTTDAGERHRRGREDRSEEHTSELQSQSNLVCRLLLEKKKKKMILCIIPHFFEVLHSPSYSIFRPYRVCIRLNIFQSVFATSAV